MAVAKMWDGAQWVTLTGDPSVLFSTQSPTALVPGNASATGSSSGVPRVDHVHGLPDFGGPGGSLPADTASAGSATTLSRSDHRHGRETWVGPRGLIANKIDTLDQAFSNSNDAVPTFITTLDATVNVVSGRSYQLLCKLQLQANQADQNVVGILYVNGSIYYDSGFVKLDGTNLGKQILLWTIYDATSTGALAFRTGFRRANAGTATVTTNAAASNPQRWTITDVGLTPTASTATNGATLYA